MVLLLIAGIPLTMILAATWLWFFVVRGDLDLVSALGTANRGSLVQPPRQIDAAPLRDADGAPHPYASLEPRWTMLVPGRQDCAADCEHLLYLTRQIHVATGKYFNRLQRVYLGGAAPQVTALAVSQLSDGPPAPPNLAALVDGEHRGLVALHSDPQALAALFPEHDQDPSTWYLVDPRGWIMMSYNSEVGYKDVIADLKFLLKNSSG
ncbi:MAG: hypothetical protein CME59_16795 [Halioglobus sp.]|nr:hypothetical protein [Halioglobus sp.]